MRAGQVFIVASAVVFALSAESTADAALVLRDPVQGAGFVEVDGGLPLILGAPVATPLNVDVVFTDMQHIQLMSGASTNIEFGIGNTGNDADLQYRIVFDLSDMHGNLITNEALVVESIAPAGFFHIVGLDLTPLPAVIFHDFHISVETSFLGANTGSDLFDLFVAGGGGDPGTAVSGPIRFNRAFVGQWQAVPEPATLTLWGLGALTLVVLGRRKGVGVSLVGR